MWWDYKIPPLLSLCYIAFMLQPRSFGQATASLLCFLLWIIATASAGYLMNDVADQDDDIVAGKINYAARLSKPMQFGLILGFVATGFLPWLYLPMTAPILILIILELFLLAAYSFRPFRFKEKIFFGPFCDALFGHTIPSLIAILAVAGKDAVFGSVFFMILALWQLARGWRNILVHQIDDRKNDRAADTKTFVTKYGPFFTIRLINRVILPVEFILFLIFLFYLIIPLPWLFIGFIVFIIFTGLQFSIWKFFSLNKRHFLKKFLYFLNNYYENWMPVIVIISLVSISFSYIVWLFFHLLLFPNVFIYFFHNSGIIKKNILNFP